MNRRIAVTALTLSALLSGATLSSAKDPTTAPAVKAPKPKDSATQPAVKDLNRHLGFVEEAKKGDVDLLFQGDSITDGWRGGGKAVWDATFAPMKAANFGIGGDRTQHVLYRLRNGELDGITPKLVVMMIGTNNLGGDTNDQIADGVTADVNEIRTKSPTSKILLLGIFPRGFKAEDGARARIKDINTRIAKLEDKKSIFYMDIGDKFLDADGNLPKEIMPDALHPNAKGYQIWADAILPKVKELMGS